MARFEGIASIRRALSMPDGSALLDIKPDGSEWRWTSVPAARARVALACGIAAISGGWKLYISLPDDPTSNVLEIVGVSNTVDRPGPAGAGPAPGLVLHVKIAPTPHVGLENYTVTVTDASGTAVEQAVVKLHNYKQSGADDIQTHNTDRSGVADFASVTLRSKTTTTTRVVEGERLVTTTTTTHPKLTVSKDGFDTVNITLL